MTRTFTALLALPLLPVLAACQMEAPAAPEPAMAPAPAAIGACAGDPACIAGVELEARLNAMQGTDIGNGVVVQQATANNNLVTLSVAVAGDGIMSDTAWYAANQALVQGTVQSTLCAAPDYSALVNNGGILPVDVMGTAGQKLGSLVMGRCPI